MQTYMKIESLNQSWPFKVCAPSPRPRLMLKYEKSFDVLKRLGLGGGQGGVGANRQPVVFATVERMLNIIQFGS